MFINYLDYLKALQRHVEAKPKFISIASFNLNVGVSSRGTCYHGPTYQLFQTIHEQLKTQSCRSCNVLIGLPQNRDECSARIQAAMEVWPLLKFRTLTDCHLKCWIFQYGAKSGTVAIAGGRNLGDSLWKDVSFHLSTPETRELKRYYEELWDGSAHVTKLAPAPKLEITLGGKKIC